MKVSPTARCCANALTQRISLMLAIIIILSLCACSGGTDNKETVSERKETAYDSRYEADELPDYLDFDSETVTMMVWQDAPNLEFFADDLSGEAVNDAVYFRNLAVSERLNIDLIFDSVPGGEGNEASFTTTVNSIIRADDSTYNIIAGYSSVMTSLCGAGCFIPLDGVDYLQLDKPWWPEKFITDTRLNGKLFMLTGDISTNFIYRLGVTFFNKDIAEAYALDDLYTTVREGRFTVDYMISMCKDMFTDINGNSEKDYWDRFGYIAASDQTDSLVFASDIKMTDNSAEEVTLSFDYTGDKLITLLEKYTSALYYSNGCALFDRETAYSAFNRGKTLMFTDRIDAYKQIMYSDVVYGVLPLPKFDVNQADYITSPDRNATLYAIPASVFYSDTSGAVLECLASESYRQLTPALFDVALKYRYSDSPDDTEMFELIRKNITFDLLFIMSGQIDVPLFSDAVAQNDTDFASKIAAGEKSLRRTITKYFEKISEFEQ